MIPTSKKRRASTRWELFSVLTIALAMAGCTVAGSEVSKRKHESGEAAKKVSTGLSYLGQTTVEASPSPAAAAGWDSERVASGQDDWEPAVAADPANANYVYQLITRYTGPKACVNCKLPAIILRRSTDGGATWLPDQFLAATNKGQYDPQIEVAANGDVYAVWLDAFTPGSTFTKSTDHGATWSAGKSFSGKGKKPQWNDKPWLSISRNGQHVYLGFNSSDSYIVASHDGGNTFSRPVKTNNDTRYWFHTGGAVAPLPTNGSVAYFACSTYSNGNNYAGDSYVDVLKTTDGGVTWSDTRVDTSREVPPCAYAAGCQQGFLGTSPGLAIDSAGKLMIVYQANDTPDAPEQIYVRTSTDGVTWSARQKISVPSPTVNNSFPAIAAHPSVAGDFRITWQDDRNLSQTGWNTWYKRTTNGGSSWSADIRLSDLASGAPFKSANGFQFPYGDYFEMAVSPDGWNHVIWGAGTSYSGPGGCWYTRGQ